MEPVNLRLIHWNTFEAETKARHLETVGFFVQFDLPPFPELLRQLGQTPPDVILIDLSRLPSQGRDLGVALRQAKATRHIPLLFVGGPQQKVERIRELLPDALFTNWEEIESALKQALTSQPAAPVSPASRFAAYAGTPLPKKLGIRAGFKVGLVGAPPEFANFLDELPSGVTLQAELATPCDLAIWFVRSLAELEQDLYQVTQAAGDIPLWIAWEKKTARPVGEAVPGVTQTIVRNTGLAAGWVDYKICSIDEHWSGLLFRKRKPG
jgi:CheY-like chemotaxis protein